MGGGGGRMDGVQGEVGHRVPVVEFQEWKFSWSLDLSSELTAEVIEHFFGGYGGEGVCVCGHSEAAGVLIVYVREYISESSAVTFWSHHNVNL